MAVTTLSSREFNQDVGRAKRAAKNGPVVITDRGRPAHVLLSIEEYQRLSASAPDDFIERMGQPPGVADIEFDPPRSRELPRPADFS